MSRISRTAIEKRRKFRNNPPEMNGESTQAIAARIEITRLALGYKTQGAFAAAIDRSYTPQRWNNYVAGRDRLPLNVALKLCQRFGLTLDWIYRGDTNGLPVRLARQIEEIVEPARPLTPDQKRKKPRA